MNKFNFRVGNIEDLEGVIELNVRAWQQFREMLTAENWNRFHEGLTDRSKISDLLQNTTAIVCEHNNKIIGVAYLVSSGNPTDIYPADWCYIRFLGVDPVCRGHKIGAQLTQLCIDKARANNEQVIALHTSEMMDAARHIYGKLGFSIVKEISARFGKQYWLYKLDL